MPYRSLTDALMAREAGGTQPIQSSRGRQGHAPTALVTLQVNTGRQHRAKQPAHTHTHTDDTYSQQINSQYTKIIQFIVKVDLQFLHSAETIRYERKGHHILCKLNDSLHSQSPTSL